MNSDLERAREAAASVHPYSHNSALILDGERDGTDIVRAALAAIQDKSECATRDAEIERLRSALEEIAALSGEINPNNYGHDDVCILNDGFVETYRIVRAALSNKDAG